jgi:hypothetical protein
VHQWFNTTKNIRHEHLVAIAKEFGVTLDWLLTGKGEMNILPATGALPTTSDSAPARSSEKLDAARVLVDTSKSELLALAQEFEADDVETAYRLTKLAIKVDQIKALL